MGASGLSTKEIDDLVFQQVAASALKNAGHWPGLKLEEITSNAAGTDHALAAFR